MGCASSTSGRIMTNKKGNQQLKGFTIKVEDPRQDFEQEFSYQTENDELPIMQIMNGIAFDETEKGNKFDANFIAIMNEKKGDFDYYVQRLMGLAIENEDAPVDGKIWVPYINNKREDWSFLCENNRIIAKEDEIVWRYENYFEKDMLNAEQLGYQPHVDDIGSGHIPSTKAVNSRMEER
ncbi:UNKNOWN [Stylonychia lemnae]|uniref:Uncharacterized protein n=1 Tax=Stylonychia lemnae TaxID=5949 RepID=A0A078AXI7_STYLE|nr:UNKNOWN [Stylonychia lemnae]|eukprot:CDW86786.1 UNKNOWN [Stylonychia lemnae]